ncbi:D-2-hydroxyacid dehydrogenase family protein [Brenneria goodwinii]|uniref:D-2-hydroxyacid dehydrogenase family protein n=1 Tax=Brenneria goodwinii TaxID=1109412 RepID=UPI000EF252B0|nr:D-2-hydroxyacid dehydrogenase family protein [Brenneria goodwinii]MCG8157256.1 D-2-hydroxyacid dehydrogenase family protein [Brenneria goodwinii]MCG8162210.1 D-2-hydroxyacid dehydrogenase family protein [Brenneria goodwinii]MCG8166140.1 D-2-hydroxyacid dehydrogenase family protein [Brenneria goodwinii]MCG8170767.1 D-2-hydroxyacid dehydrogenase family protein [Brenneria goodwinii]MCG8175836.1 D-2-hydroxyacid dehydrogenase family protein [Brenneria goodwinii]
MQKIAILDDYQGVALKNADWSPVMATAEIVVFRDHLENDDALVERLYPFDAICVMRERTPLTAGILERLPNLKFIGSNAPYNASIDLDAARRMGVIVSGTGGRGNGAPELTWALILAAARHIPTEHASIRAGGWQVDVGADLEGSTLGLLGLGKIGTRVASVGRALGMTVIAWSQNLTAESADVAGVKLVDKNTLLRESDWLSVHLVLSDRTEGIIGAPELALMKANAWLVNTSRGPLVEEAALIDALSRHVIAGAALDVFHTEPLPDVHPFRTLDNVLSTPHIGFVTQGTYRVFYEETVENLVAWMNGSPRRVIAK